MSGASERPAGRVEARLDWLDGTKGIAILWIAFFHFFIAYNGGRLPWLLDPGYLASYERICASDSPAARALCVGSAVLTAAVVAQPDPKWGETPCAFLELKPGAVQPDDKEVVAFCQARLARFKVPKVFIYGPLPKTSTGKIQKFVLRDQAGTL